MNYEELVQVSGREASLYEEAGVLVQLPEPPAKGLEPEELVWEAVTRIWIGLFAPRWACMIARAGLSTEWATRAIKRAHHDETARKAFITAFALCGGNAEDRRDCVCELLLDRACLSDLPQ